MSDIKIFHAGRESEERFSAYLFDVLIDGRKVAELGHDHRGDEHWLRVPGGAWIDLPSRVIEGGGPHPLSLSAAGVSAIRSLINGS